MFAHQAIGVRFWAVFGTRLGLARTGLKECLAHRDTVVRFRARVDSGLDPSRPGNVKFLTELVPGQRTRLQPKKVTTQ